MVDQNGHGVVILGSDGSYQGRQLGFGSGDGLLAYPPQVYVNERGEMFVADRSNNRLQVFTTER